MPGRDRILVVIAVLGVIFASLLAVSSQSLWIDEANSAVKAVAPTWVSFIASMSSERGTDLQMPGYMALLWVWEKAFGPGEYALRCLNIPFFLGSLAVVFFALKTSLRRRTIYLLLACSSAFLWAYLDEARPYILQFFGASLAMTGLYNLTVSSSREKLTRDSIAVLLGLFILLSSSLSTLCFGGLFGVTFLCLLIRNHPISSLLRNKALLGVGCLFLVSVASLGAYYFWTLHVGAKASAVGKTNLASIAFCFYELAGYTGIGPARAALREAPFLALRQEVFPLVAYTVVIACLGFACLSAGREGIGKLSKSLLFLIFVVIVGTILMFGLGVGMHFRVLGRHLMPAFPFFILGVSITVDQAVRKYGRFGWTALFVFLAVSLFSSLQIRFSARHSKDDYRDAATLAKTTIQREGVVWWAADNAGAKYYGLDAGIPDASNSHRHALAVSIPAISGRMTYEELPLPQVVILSKSDIYDPKGRLAEWLDTHHFSIIQRFPAFTVWSLQ